MGSGAAEGRELSSRQVGMGDFLVVGEQMMSTKRKPMDWRQPERGELMKGYILVVVSASQHSYSEIAVDTMQPPVQ